LPTARIHFVAAALLMLVVVFVFNGTLPGLLTPTTAQLFWATGFSQSFINDGFSIYAHNFGAPEPAAMAFGLAGALPVSAFLKLGLSAADAYSASFALWLAVAFGGAYKLARRWGGEPFISLMLAAVWCTMPVVWEHQGYSMLALGIALLPFYFYCSARVLDRPTSIANFILFLFACLVAVFMDGYTYMMFAVATGFAFLFSLVRGRANTIFDVACRLLSIGIGFSVSYVLYTKYIGQPEFSPAPLDFFRGWGANVEFFFVATKGILLLPDLLGLSDARAAMEYFGDSSVFKTTFSAAILVAAIVAAMIGTGDRRALALFGIIALFGFYMALGPSLKVLTYRPAGMDQLMPESYGLLSTGSSILSGSLPGFKNMRASYRWIALGLFGCWAILAMVLAGRPWSAKRKAVVLLAVAAFNIPALSIVRSYYDTRFVIYDREAEVQKLAPLVNKGETIAFLPYRNDFLVNYLASRLDIRTYNIGGDKNLASAWEHWPDTMKRFTQDELDPEFTSNVRAVLENEDADAVILPYIDLLWAAHGGPLKDVLKDELSAVAETLDADPRLTVSYIDRFAVVRLNAGLRGMGDAWVAQSYDPRLNRKAVKLEQGSSVSFRTGDIDPEYLVHRGWSRLEPGGIWSKRNVANLLLDLPMEQDVTLRIELTPFVPRPKDQMTVQLSINGTVVLERAYAGPWPRVAEKVTLPGSALRADGLNVLELKAAPLLSPMKIGIPDPRVLGVMLHKISVE
jgi:hypothetical protein